MTYNIKKQNLFLIAFITWLVIGGFLLSKAIIWAFDFTKEQLIYTLIISIIIAFFKVRYVFYTSTVKNINRINKLPDNLPFWEFHKPMMYILILFMIALGIFLRTSGFFKFNYIFPIYFGVGAGMAITSFQYLVEYKKY